MCYFDLHSDTYFFITAPVNQHYGDSYPSIRITEYV